MYPHKNTDQYIDIAFTYLLYLPRICNWMRLGRPYCVMSTLKAANSKFIQSCPKQSTNGPLLFFSLLFFDRNSKKLTGH